MKMRAILCWLVTVCVVIFAIALPAAAETTSGNCGENVSWSFDESTGTLIFSGTGKITFNSFSGSLWSGYKAKIQKVIFEKGISAIQDGAFANYSALKQIVFLGDKPTVELTTFYKVTATAYYPPNNGTWAEGGFTNHGGTLYWVAGAPGTSGFCGDDLNWCFQDGILTISGVGPMYDYGTKNWMPWLDYKDSVVEVVILPGVTSIGRAAFANCGALKQITIAESVQSIGEQAFLFCRSLTAIRIPNGVTTVRELTFSNCPSLSKIVIPSSVEEIHADTFEGSRGMKEIYFYGSAPTVSGMLMNGCFGNAEATAYYPADDLSWTEEAKAKFGSAITWKENLCVKGHTEAVKQGKKVTCTENGLTEGKYCSVCNEVLLAQKTIFSSGHKEVVDAAVKASCTETGLTEGKHCSVCSEVFLAQQTVPVIDHNYGQWKEVMGATTTETGLEERECGVCGHKEKKTIEKLDPPLTQPTTKQTEPPTQPTQPATKPTEPTNQPTTVPVEPESKPTASTALPAETNPAASTAPAQPTTGTKAPEQPREEPENYTVVWVLVSVIGAAALWGTGILVFKKTRMK